MTEQDKKFSRFMFHIKFSNTDDFVHEHELYELMRSRNLYQSQFGVRTHFRKIMRNIEISEKAQRYSFENSRNIFVQKMKERREQAAKFKSFSNNDDDDGKKTLPRRYVPIPESTTVYSSELPEIVPPKVTPTEHIPETFTNTPSIPVQTTPSLVTAAFTPDIASARPRKNGRNKHRQYTATSKSIIAGREGHVTYVQEQVPQIREETAYSQNRLLESEFAIRGNTSSHSSVSAMKESSQRNSAENITCVVRVPRHTDSASGQHNTLCESDRHVPPDEVNGNNKSVTKVEEWAEKHRLLKTDLEHDQFDIDLHRLMLDRPSKLGVNSRSTNQEEVLTEYGTFAKKSFDTLKKRLKKSDRKSSQRFFTLPELDNTPKPMVTMDAGGTTPGGRLILTTADYKAYLADFNKARIVRLSKTKKQQQSLDKLVENFRVGSPLLLRDTSKAAPRSSAKTV